MIKKNFEIIVVLWAAFASMASAQDRPELAAVRAQAVASAVYNVALRPESERVQRRQFAEDLAKAFVTGEGNYVDRLLEPYSMEPRARVSRELLGGGWHFERTDSPMLWRTLKKQNGYVTTEDGLQTCRIILRREPWMAMRMLLWRRVGTRRRWITFVILIAAFLTIPRF